MFYTKQYFWIELFLEFTLKKNAILKEKSLTFCDRWDSAYTTLLIHSYGIRKRQFSVTQFQWNSMLQFKAVLWLVNKAHVIQVDRYAFSNSK